MSAHSLRRSCRQILFALAAGVSIPGLCACGATEEVPKARVTSPVQQSDLPVPASAAWAEETPSDKPKEKAFSEFDEEVTDVLFPRRLSKSVPSRTCTKDEECGDGFCDRTACAPIWTWRTGIGQRCGPNTRVLDCGSRLCIDGRCRSCLSHAECPKAFPACGRNGTPSDPRGNSCSGLGLKEVGLPLEPPPPTPLPAPSSTPSTPAP
jgi:hypothetical protein